MRARQLNRAYTNPLPWLAVAYLQLDREEEARTRMAEAIAAVDLAIKVGMPRTRASTRSSRSSARIEAMLKKLLAGEHRASSAR